MNILDCCRLTSNVLVSQVQERYLQDGNDKLKLLVLLCGEDDDKLQIAAAGALAMLTAVQKKVCKKLTLVVCITRHIDIILIHNVLIGFELCLKGLDLVVEVVDIVIVAKFTVSFFLTDHPVARDPTTPVSPPQSSNPAPRRRNCLQHAEL